MPHEKPFKYGPLGDDVDKTNMAWTREKRRRKYLPHSSSSDSQDPISHAVFGAGEAAKDHQGPISDMAIVQDQDHALHPRTNSGEEEEETQELFGPEVILSEEDQANDAATLPPDVDPLDSMTPSMSWTENFELLARHARYRIAYYKIVKPESELKLKDPCEYSQVELCEQQYFKYLERDGGFEWFFHTDDIWNPDLDDYQRMALRTILPYSIEPEYIVVQEYHSRHHTYETDAVYVKYYEEISKKIKWIEAFLHLDIRSVEWSNMGIRGWRQALRIATKLPHMTLRVASLAYSEYISELREDAAIKGLDLVYFEIWRLVVKDNKSYTDAVKLVHAMEKYNMHKRTMEAELTGAPVFWTMKQRIYGIIHKGGLNENTEDNKARDLFWKGVAQLKTKNMVKYAEKKMEIAKRLNLHKRIDTPGQIEVP